MPSPPAVHGGGGGSIGAGPSIGPRRSTPAVSGRPVVAQLVQSTGSSDTGHLDPSVSRYRGLGLAPSGAKRRFGEVNPVDFLNQHTPENQPIPDAYTSYLWSSSPTTSTVQYPAAVPADPVQVPPSLPNYESVLSPHSGESFQLASSSGLQDDVDNSATFSPRHASSGTPSHFTDHTLPQQGKSLAAPEAPRKKRRTGQRKRVAKPKDPRAAERLQNQRESDESNLEELYRLFVPERVGVVPKKDRSAISTSQSSCLSGLVNERCQCSIMPKRLRRPVATPDKIRPPYLRMEKFGPRHPLSKMGVLIESVLDFQGLWYSGVWIYVEPSMCFNVHSPLPALRIKMGQELNLLGQYDYFRSW